MAGELSNSGVAPRAMNAIHNAVGVRLTEFPITAERIYDALQTRSDYDRPLAQGVSRRHGARSCSPRPRRRAPRPPCRNCGSAPARPMLMRKAGTASIWASSRTPASTLNTCRSIAAVWRPRRSLAGNCDIVCGTTLSVATAVAKGVPLGIVAPAAVNTTKGPQALLCVRKDGPIHTAKDMVGKTIGVNVLGTSVDLAIQAWFAKNGLDPKSAKFVEVLAAEVGAAIDRGTIDAFAQGEPALSDALRRNNVRVLADPMPAIAPRFLYAAWYATPTWAKANPDVVKRFQTAISQAGNGATRTMPPRR